MRLSTVCSIKGVKQTRGNTRVDFIQNTVTEGDWEYDAADQGGDLPEEGKFHLFAQNGNLTELGRCQPELSINGTGVTLRILRDISKGCYQHQDVLSILMFNMLF